jgi:hypothetical protein
MVTKFEAVLLNYSVFEVDVPQCVRSLSLDVTLMKSDVRIWMFHEFLLANLRPSDLCDTYSTFYI